MSEFAIQANVPGQWYIVRKGDFTNPPVALFYDLALAERFIFAASAGQAEPQHVPDMAAELGLNEHTAPMPAAALPWRCFHCDETFTDAESAKEHFGRTQVCEPACTIDAAKYRAMEETVRLHVEEDTDLHRTIYAMQARHQTELQREEEKGYARGLADGKAEQLAAAQDERVNLDTVAKLHSGNHWCGVCGAPLSCKERCLRNGQTVTLAASQATYDRIVCEREAFEAWAVEEFQLRADGLSRRGDSYKYTGICDAWAGWQARAAASPVSGAAGDDWAPRRIWLQRGVGECGSHTWCEDSQEECEQAEYVRVRIDRAEIERGERGDNK